VLICGRAAVVLLLLLLFRRVGHGWQVGCQLNRWKLAGSLVLLVLLGCRWWGQDSRLQGQEA
jgi:hypothetical protein